MPMSQEPSQEPTDKMFIENANQRPHCHHEFFLRSRPYRGELPTVAGFLLYPDTPAKMETTSQEAFCFRPIPQQGRGKGKGNSSCRDRKPGKDEQQANHDQTGFTSVKKEQDTIELQSQYQKDFPPPSSFRRRQAPALPQPDNIGINPAFRIEFNTVQKETYPGWPIINSAGRLRGASSKLL